MVSLLSLVAVLATAPDPVASLAPAPPTALTEIGRTHSLPACATLLGHANAAIVAVLDDDRALTTIALNIRSADFGKLNDYQRQSAIETLLKQGAWVRTNAHAADVEVRRAEDALEATTDAATHQTDLVAFTAALDAAAKQQEQAATAFVGAITVLAGRQDRSDVDAAVASGTGIQNRGVGPLEPTAYKNAGPQTGLQGANTAAQRYGTGIPGPALPSDYDKVFGQIVKQLNQALAEILHDEGTAADHALAATGGC
jgi:hypothetical protein